MSMIFKIENNKIYPIHFVGITQNDVNELKKEIIKYTKNCSIEFKESKLYYVDDTDFCEVIKSDHESFNTYCCMIDEQLYSLKCIDLK